LKLGLIINPVAGLGGAVALKGSDSLAAEALQRGAVPMAHGRAEAFLSSLDPERLQHIRFYTAAGEMGQRALEAKGLHAEKVIPVQLPSSSTDTQSAAVQLAACVDLLVFVGGDGTARDVYSAVRDKVVCLGVPAGGKKHSGVFAVNPQSAGQIVNQMLSGQVVAKLERVVKDIDEDAFRAGRVIAKTYGSLWVPEAFNHLQMNKEGGRENEALAQLDIAQDIMERLLPDWIYFIGPGSTTMAVKQGLGIDGTLLGVDVVQNGVLVLKDATAAQLLDAFQPGRTQAIVTIIGGQGHLFGRGNQQFCAELIRKLGLNRFWIIATQAKIRGLAQRPLHVDTGDAKLDHELTGMVEITIAYQQRVLLPIQD